MSSASSPVGLGLSIPQITSVEPTHQFSDLAARQVPAPYASTASVAPLPSPYLPETAQTNSLRAPRLESDSFVHKSPALASRSFAVNAALLAGSVSVLVGVGGMVGVACYRRKKIGRIKGGSSGKGRKRRIRGTKGDPEDVEAGLDPLVRHLDAESYDGKSSASGYTSQMSRCLDAAVHLETCRSPSLDASTPSISPWSMSSSAPMLANAAPRPFVTEDLSDYLVTPSMSSVRLGQLHDALYTAHASPSSELELGGIGNKEELDLGGVVLSSLKMHEEYDAIESYDDHEVLAESVLPKASKLPAEGYPQLGYSSDMSNVTGLGSLGERVSPFLSQPASPPSPVALPFEAQMHMIDSPASTTSSNGQDLTIASIPTYPILSTGPTQRPTESPPKLLELTLNSEVDLHAWLGLIPDEPDVRATCLPVQSLSEVPELVATDSQETVTGTDESFDGQSSMEGLSESSTSQFGSGENMLQSITMPGKEYDPHVHSRRALFKHIVTRASIVHNPPASLPPTRAVSPSTSEAQIPSKSLGVSQPSLPSSSTSAATLKMPSFRSPGLALLTEEVLPPPSIIVSVPTEASIVPRDSSWGSCVAASSDQRRWYSGREKVIRVAGTVTEVIHDESEDEVWDDAYERTSFVEATGRSAGADSNLDGFAESGMLSSESSELDIGKAVANFPLPPDGPLLRKSLTWG